MCKRSTAERLCEELERKSHIGDADCDSMAAAAKMIRGLLELALPVRYTQDGDQLCATRLDFINLQESPAGLGSTEMEALVDLERNEAGYA